MNLNKNDPQIQQFEEYMNMDTMYYYAWLWPAIRMARLMALRPLAAFNIPDNMRPF